MNSRRIAPFVGLALCLAGCMSTEVEPSAVTGVEHFTIHDYGWKLFDCIPLFRSDITVESVQKELAEVAAKRGKTPEGLVYHNRNDIFLELPLLGTALPIPYIICYHEVQLSGVFK